MFDVRIEATDGDLPLAGCNITIFMRSLHDQNIISIDVIADEVGRVVYSMPDDCIVDCLLISPICGSWAMRADGPLVDARVICPRLPKTGPMGWWHNVMGQHAFDLAAAEGIRIGVVDSGLAPHHALAHAVRVGAFLSNGSTTGTLDQTSHGTHVAGLIGARPVQKNQFGGVAPGATLLIARAIDETGYASSLDVAEAITCLALDHEADLINLSLGADQPSAAIEDAIKEAAENGCLCFAAAGNDFGPFAYPAAFEHVVAIAACGRIGWAPPFSLAATFQPSNAPEFGSQGLYCATFSGRGPEIDAIAPGVGLISTVATTEVLSTGYGAMNGTSMAAPMACGALACMLATRSDYLSMRRDAQKTRTARDVFRKSLRDLGLSPRLQGGGIPAI